jgi:hypothetical protein
MGSDEHGPAYPEPPQCSTCGSLGMEQWCARDNCPGRNPLPEPCPLCGSPNLEHTVFYKRNACALEKPVSNTVKCPACLFIATLIIIVLLGALFFACVRPAAAFDHGFDPYDPTVQWFEQLKRHDYMPYSCCGKADAYAADLYTRNPDGSYDVTITDGSAITFPDGTKRPELPNGSVVHVPAGQINPPTETQGNPTGHSWLFVSIRRVYDDAHPGGDAATPGLTYCFAPLPEGS